MYSRSRTRAVNGHGGRQRRIDAIAERHAFLNSQLALLAAGADQSQESRIPNIIRNRNRTGFKPQPRYVYTHLKALTASASISTTKNLASSSSSGDFEQLILCSSPTSPEGSEETQSPESSLQTQRDLHHHQQEEVPLVAAGVGVDVDADDLEQNQQMFQEIRGQGLDLETISSQDGTVMVLLDEGGGGCEGGGVNLESQNQNQPENDFDFQTLNSDLDVDLAKAVEGEGELTETEPEPDTYVIVETPEGSVLVPSAMYPQLVNNFNFNSSGVPTTMGFEVEGQTQGQVHGGLVQVTTTASTLENGQIPQVIDVAPAPSSTDQNQTQAKRKSQLIHSHNSEVSPRFSQNHHQHHNYTKSSTLIRPTFKSRKVPYKVPGVTVVGGGASSSSHRPSQSQSSSVQVLKKKTKVIPQKPQIPQSQLSLSSLIKKINNNNNNDVVLMAHQDQEKPRPFRFELSADAEVDVEVDDEFGGGFRNVPIPIMINSLRSETEKNGVNQININ